MQHSGKLDNANLQMNLDKKEKKKKLNLAFFVLFTYKINLIFKENPLFSVKSAGLRTKHRLFSLKTLTCC